MRSMSVRQVWYISILNLPETAYNSKLIEKNFRREDNRRGVDQQMTSLKFVTEA